MRYHFSPVRLAKIKKFDNKHHCQECEENTFSYIIDIYWNMCCHMIFGWQCVNIKILQAYTLWPSDSNAISSARRCLNTCMKIYIHVQKVYSSNGKTQMQYMSIMNSGLKNAWPPTEALPPWKRMTWVCNHLQDVVK